MSAPQSPIAVLGAGSWGTALAVLIARNGRPVRLWGHDPKHLARLAAERANAAYLPGIAFPAGLEPEPDLARLAPAAGGFLIAVPSHAFRAVLTALQPHLPGGALLAWATKGLEPASGKLLHEVVAETLGAVPGAVISGPSFAREVAQGLPTALIAAAADPAVAESAAAWLRDGRVRVYTGRDVVGVELGGAVKNVLAIAAGISDGLGFGANARAALITRGLAELRRLGEAVGGRPETLMGLAGLGDLVLTCTDDLSRNRRLGLALGRGQALAAASAAIGQVTEGAATARVLRALAQRHGVDMPICEQVYRVLYEGLAPPAAVEALLKRDPRPE
jgi:glycerol-3-phosphate dehydrogenase (NAD(P)+)